MSLKRALFSFALLIGVAVATPSFARAEFVVPELTGPVVDAAGIIDPATAAQLNHVLRDLYNGGGSQIQILTVPSLQGDEIEQASIKVADKWKIGRKKDGTGALLILSSGDHKVRIEVGQGLEGVLPDAIAKRIIDQKMTPLLRSGAMSDAILVGTASIISVTDPKFDLAAAFGNRRVRQPRDDDDPRSSGPSPLVVIIFLIVVLVLGSFGRRGGGGGFFIGGGGFGGGGFGGGSGGSWGGGGGGFNGGGASGGW